MQQVLHEVARQTALFHWLQGHTVSLLHLEDKSLSVLCPRMVCCFGVSPKTFGRQKTRSAQLTYHRRL
jgi:hypothetical protein